MDEADVETMSADEISNSLMDTNVPFKSQFFSFTARLKSATAWFTLQTVSADPLQRAFFEDESRSGTDVRRR